MDALCYSLYYLIVTEEHESNQLNSVANSISTPSSPVLSLHSQRFVNSCRDFLFYLSVNNKQNNRSASPDSVEAQNRLKKYFYRTFSPHIAKDFDKQINVFLDKLVQVCSMLNLILSKNIGKITLYVVRYAKIRRR